jgi:hypothetical protein
LTGKLTILILNLTFGISSVVIGQKILKKLEESYFSEWLALENLTSGNAENGAIHKSMRFRSWLDSKKYTSLEDIGLDRLCGWVQISLTAFYISLMISVLLSLIWHQPAGDLVP